MLDLPGIVDAELVGEFDLVERVLEQALLVALVPRPRQLMFVEDAEFHGRILEFIVLVVDVFRCTDLSRGSAASASAIFAAEYAFSAALGRRLIVFARSLAYKSLFQSAKTGNNGPNQAGSIAGHEQWEVFAMLRRLLALAVVTATLVAPTLASAEDYPVRPIKLINPFPAGGPADIIARTVGQRMSGDSRPADRGREPRGSRRHHRRRFRRQGRARRLRDRHLQPRRARDQSELCRPICRTTCRRIWRRSVLSSACPRCWSSDRRCRPRRCRSSSPTPRRRTAR